MIHIILCDGLRSEVASAACILTAGTSQKIALHPNLSGGIEGPQPVPPTPVKPAYKEYREGGRAEKKQQVRLVAFGSKLVAFKS